MHLVEGLGCVNRCSVTERRVCRQPMHCTLGARPLGKLLRGLAASLLPGLRAIVAVRRIHGRGHQGRNAPFGAALRPPRRVPLRQGRQGHSHPSLAPPRQPCRSGSVPSRALRRQPGPASRRAYLPVPRLVPPPVPRRPSPRAAQRRTIQNQGLAAAKLRRARLSSHLGRLLHWLLRLLRHLEARRRLVVDLPRQPQS